MHKNNNKFITLCFVVFVSLSIKATSQPTDSYRIWFGDQLEASAIEWKFINQCPDFYPNLGSNNLINDSFPNISSSQYYYQLITAENNKSTCTTISAWINYKTQFENICRELKIPTELAVLPLALSAMNTHAISISGNTGIWQLQYLIAIKYGLRIESFYDERLSPILSANAALHYIKDLYQTTANWYLAISAYSCGMPELNKAIKKCGNSSPDSLYLYLPESAKHTYPMFLAMLQLTQQYQNNIKQYPQLIAKPISAKVEITTKLHLEQISSVLQIDPIIISDYNPLFTDFVIDGRKQAVPLLLSPSKALLFEELQDSISHYLDSIYFPKPPQNQQVITESGSMAFIPGAGYERIDYLIKPGDNIGAIAETYDIDVTDLRDWNGISGNTIYAGKVLYIYKPEADAQKYRSISKKESVKPEKSAIPEGSNEIIYTVKSGDSPYTIAKKYEGVSDNDILNWNGISDPSKLQVGQKLKIYITE
jgi:membrane-bound lytic murein transglycosylase D